MKSTRDEFYKEYFNKLDNEGKVISLSWEMFEDLKFVKRLLMVPPDEVQLGTIYEIINTILTEIDPSGTMSK